MEENIKVVIIGVLSGLFSWSLNKSISDGVYNICTQIKYSREEILRELKSIQDNTNSADSQLRKINDRLKRISEHLGAEMSDAKPNKLISEAGKNGDEAEKTINQQKTMVREADRLIEEFEKIISETEK